MPRGRKNDHDSVVGAAQVQFWQNGYVGTSTRMIEESTGLTRFTLQTAYGGKEAFFLETLDAYLDRAENQYFPNPATARLEDLAIWFENFSDELAMPRIGDQGCLLLNAINDFDRGNGQVDARIARYFDCLQERFTQIIANAIDRGDAIPDLEPRQNALLLISLLLGLSTIIKARTDNSMVKSHTAAAAEMIRSWRAKI